ncbi:MAG: peptidylprolyl isomerase [Bacteroidetes bacterium]|nr:peptidylprolyl isomerase [Bacteroidota bacterium]
MRKFILKYSLAVFSICHLPSCILHAQDSTRLILIETSYGNIKLKLYNETSLHRDNFLKLIGKHFYDSLLFHRVINTFMIQGGDPDSKNAPPEKMLGDGDAGYLIPAEFNQKLFHKRGALAAARDGDEVNPEQKSSGCQFYIVQGRIFTDSLLDLVEKRITHMKAYNNVVKKPENKKLLEKYWQFMQQQNPDSMFAAKKKIDALTEEEFAKLPRINFLKNKEMHTKPLAELHTWMEATRCSEK